MESININTDETTTTTVTLKWQAISNTKFESYKIAYKKVIDGSEEEYETAGKSESSKILENLTPDTSYKVRIQTKKGTKFGRWSNWVDFKTKRK